MTINRKFVTGWLVMLWLAITLLGVGLSLEGSLFSITMVGFLLLTATATLITLWLPEWFSATQELTSPRRSEAELHDLFAAIDDVVLVVDAEGRYRQIAPTSPHNLYKPSAELLGKTMHEVLPLDFADYFLAQIHQTLKQQQPVDLDYELPIGGQVTWFSGRMSPIAADRVILVSRNITERKQTEQALQESEAKHRALLTTLPDLVVRCNADGICLDFFASQTFPIIGQNQKIIGTRPHELLPPKASQQRIVAIQTALATGEMQIYEQEVFVRGNWQIEECRVMVCGKDEVLILVRDVTERKQSEQVLQSLLASTAATTGEAFFSTLVEQIATTLNVSCVVVSKQVGDYLETMAMTDSGQLISNYCFLAEHTPCKQVLNHGELYCETGLQQAFPNDFDLALLNAESYLGFAIRDSSGQTIGVACILDSRPIVWSESTETLLKIFTDRAGAELERLQAVAELKHLNQELELRVQQRTEQLQLQTRQEQALNQIVQLVRSSLDLETVFSTTTQAVSELLKIGKAVIAQYQPDQERWVHISESRYDQSLPETIGLVIADAENPFASKLKRFEAVKIDDTSTIEDPINQPIAQTLPGAWLLLPLVVNQQIWGALTLLQSTAAAFSETDIELGQRIADQLAIAIQQAELYRQVQTEKEKLRHSEAVLAEAQQIAHVGNWELDAATWKITWSAELSRIFGLAPSHPEPSYADLLNCIHPDDRDCLQQALDQAIQFGISYEIDLRLLKPDGSLGYIEARGKIERNEQGQVIRVFGTALDITDRKRTEQALRQSEQRFRTLFEATPNPIQGYNRNREVIFWNRASEALYGYSREEALGQPVEALIIPPVYHADLIPLVDDWIAGMGDAVPNSEFELQHKDGSSLAVHSSHVMLTNLDGESEMYCIDIDLRELKQAQVLLQQANAQLELRVEERTAELRQAKEAAEAANQAKSVFLANMSHELRTPLNGILGYTQILQRGSSLTQEDQRGLDIIYQCGEHLLELINDLLDLSKIEAQKLELAPQTIHLGNFLANVTSLCRIKAEQKGLEFIAQFSPQLPISVQVDAKRLQQILLNLLSNAVKFTDTGSVTFQIEISDAAEQRSDDSSTPVQFIRFQVQDTGIGIAPDQLETIFLPFEQAGHKARQAEGTGLGLAITRTLVRMMGGELLVNSKLRQGSTFYFELPLSVLTTPELPALSTSFSKDSVTGFQGPARKILIVDDHWTNRTVLIDLLQPLGFILGEAANGLEALKQATTFQPDLIITDLRMPVMDGWEMTRQIRTNRLLDSICVIAVSALPFQQVELLCRRAGCNDFIAKPIQAEALLDKLKLHLQLDWIYATSTRVVQPISASALMIPPAARELTQLYELAQKGRILRIAQQAEALKQDPRLIPFASELIQLAENFEVEKLLNFVAQFISPQKNANSPSDSGSSTPSSIHSDRR